MQEAWSIVDLGRMAYAPALDKQREVNEAVIAGEAGPTLLLVEHDPVITVSRRKSAPGHLLASPGELDRLGIAVAETDRGGDITYHGPGQLVAYPILRLKQDLGLSLVGYMRWLEDVLIQTLGAFGVAGQRVEGCTGIWVDQASQTGPAKIAALGVRVRRGVTMHGLALNVSPEMSHFATIVPCGLYKPVTSLKEVLSDDCPPMPAVKVALMDAMRSAATAS